MKNRKKAITLKILKSLANQNQKNQNPQNPQNQNHLIILKIPKKSASVQKQKRKLNQINLKCKEVKNKKMI